MDVNVAFRIDAALTNLERHADVLRAVDIPALIGRPAAKRAAAESVSLALADANRAFMLLSQNGAQATARHRIADAVMLLEAYPRANDSIHNAGRVLHDAATFARDAQATEIESGIAQKLMDIGLAPAESRTPEDAALLATATSDRLSALRAAQLPAAERTARASTLLTSSPTTLTRDDWLDIAGIAESELAPGVTPVLNGVHALERDAPLAQVARDIAAGKIDAANRAPVRYFEAWQTSQLPLADRVARANEIVATHTSEIPHEQWVELKRLMDSDPTHAAIGIVGDAERSSTIGRVASGIAAGVTTPNPSIQRDFDAWRLAGTTAEQRAAMVREIVTTPAANITRRQWQDLAAVANVEPDRAPGILDLTAGGDSLARIAERIAFGKSTYDVDVPRALDAAAAATMPRAAFEEQLAAFASRNPADLSTDEWRTFGALLDARTAVIPPESIEYNALRFGKHLAETAAGKVTNTLNTSTPVERQYDVWRVAQMTPAQREAEATRLFTAGGPDNLSRTDWQRMYSLLMNDPEGTTMRVPAILPNKQALGNIADALAAGQDYFAADARAYFTAWTFANAPANVAIVDDMLTTLAHAESGAVSTAAANATEDTLALIRLKSDNVVTALNSHSPIEQTRITARLLASPDVAASYADTMPSVLELTRTALTRVEPGAAPVAALRDETVALIDTNLARLRGATPTGAIKGYGTHPDYAEIGEIRANAEIIAMQASAHAEAEARHIADATALGETAATSTPTATDVIVW